MNVVNQKIWVLITLVLLAIPATASAAQVITEPTTITEGDAGYIDQDIVVDGTTLYLQGLHRFESLRLQNNARIELAEGVVGELARIELSIATNLTIEEGAEITVSGRGYGLAEGQPRYAGGSHGGRGGNYNSDYRSLPGHGSISGPTTLGYGGRYSNVVRGGGALKIQAASVDLSGTITSAGKSQYHGSGAGGSIWLDVGTLTIGASGRIDAAGGYSEHYGGGGGGRVHVAYDSVDGALEDSVRAPGSGRYNSTNTGGSGTVLLEDRSAGTRTLVIDNEGRRDGNVTEIASLPLDLDELQIRNARVKLDVAAVPPLVVDNSTVELTVPEVPELVANNSTMILNTGVITTLKLTNSTATLGANAVTNLSMDSSTVSQSKAMTLSTLTLENASTWKQAGYDLTISDSYTFTNSRFDYSGTWVRPGDPAALIVNDYTLTLPSGTHQYDRVEIGANGQINVSPYDATTEQGGRLALDVNELVVAEGGVLSASGAGYGLAEGQPRYAGGSHGGRGGNYNSDYRSLPGHGSISGPTTLGY
ncbi:hypothetical protein, partial [Marinobacter arenosus]|uniref:hypothetical protein n=1 Tax=Marinobacter arenosus TaxID=2856822 RepID=UPI001C4B8F9A